MIAVNSTETQGSELIAPGDRVVLGNPWGSTPEDPTPFVGYLTVLAVEEREDGIWYLCQNDDFIDEYADDPEFKQDWAKGWYNADSIRLDQEVVGGAV